MGKLECRITRYVHHTRIYIYTREGAKKPYGLRQNNGAVSWYASIAAIDRVIAKLGNRNRGNTRKYAARIKEAFFVCACGCGETFQAAFKTRKPKFKNDAHRLAYQNKIRADKRAADMKRKLQEQRKRRIDAKKDTLPSKGKSNLRDGGVEGERGKEGEGASPSFTAPTDKGLFQRPETPERKARRRAVGLPEGRGK